MPANELLRTSAASLLVVGRLYLAAASAIVIIFVDATVKAFQAAPGELLLQLFFIGADGLIGRMRS